MLATLALLAVKCLAALVIFYVVVAEILAHVPRWTGVVPVISTILGWFLDDVAVTWWNVTFILPKLLRTTGSTVLPARTQRHEDRHAWQFAQAVLTFPFRYWKGNLDHGYTNNPYELDAVAAETDLSLAVIS